MVNESDYLSSLASVMTGKRTAVIIKGKGAAINKDGKTNYIVLPQDGAFNAAPMTETMTEAELADLNKHVTVTSTTAHDVAKELNASEDSVKQYLRRMMAYHESAHGKYSPSNESLKEMNEELRNIYMCFEDRRIEARFASEYPNIWDHFSKLNTTMFKGASFDLKDIDAEALPPNIKLYLLAMAATMKHYGLDIPEEYDENKIVQRIYEGLDEVESDCDNQQLPRDLAEEIMRMMKLSTAPQPQSGLNSKSKAKPKPQKGGGGGSGGQQQGQRPKDEQGDDKGGKSESDKKDEPDDGEDESEPDDGDAEQPGEGEPDGITSKDISDLEDEYEKNGIEAGGVGKNSAVNLRTAALIDQALAQRIAAVLKNIRGSKTSMKEENSDDGYMMDIGEVMQMKASPNISGFKPFIDSAKDAPDYDIVITIDHSGSMSESNKMTNAAKAAAVVSSACQRVKIDTAIMAFTGESAMVKPFEMPVEHSPLAAVEPNGGTAIAVALKDAVDLLILRKRQSNGSRKQALILVSDGEDYDMHGIANELARAERNDIKTFFIGLGSGPRELIRGLAQFARFRHASIIDGAGRNMAQELRRMAESFIKESQ